MDKFLDNIHKTAEAIEEVDAEQARLLEGQEKASAEILAYLRGRQRVQYRLEMTAVGDAERILNERADEGWRLVNSHERGDDLVLILERASGPA